MWGQQCGTSALKVWHIPFLIMSNSNTDFQIIEQIDTSNWNAPFAVRRCDQTSWVGIFPRSMLKKRVLFNLTKHIFIQRVLNFSRGPKKMANLHHKVPNCLNLTRGSRSSKKRRLSEIFALNKVVIWKHHLQTQLYIQPTIWNNHHCR